MFKWLQRWTGSENPAEQIRVLEAENKFLRELAGLPPRRPLPPQTLRKRTEVDVVVNSRETVWAAQQKQKAASSRVLPDVPSFPPEKSDSPPSSTGPGPIKATEPA